MTNNCNVQIVIMYSKLELKPKFDKTREHAHKDSIISQTNNNNES